MESLLKVCYSFTPELVLPLNLLGKISSASKDLALLSDPDDAEDPETPF